MKLILASNSPRRREILQREGIDFCVIPSSYEEEKTLKLGKKTAEYFAKRKAQDVYDSLEDKCDKVVLGADTIVYLDGEILEKPKDYLDAKNMLKRLSSKKHLVITGYSFIGENLNICDSEISEVLFNDLSDEDIDKYIAEMKPFDKAGSYGIQDGYNLVKTYRGSFDNIVGLPIEKILEVLRKIN